MSFDLLKFSVQLSELEKHLEKDTFCFFNKCLIYVINPISKFDVLLVNVCI